MKKRPSDFVERERRDGLVRPPPARRMQSAPVATVQSSLELALNGDFSLLDQRLSAGLASADEQKLAADILTRRAKSQRKKLSHLLTEDRRQLVVEFIQNGERQNPGIKRESLVVDAMNHFGISRSEVFTSLDLFESK